MCTRSASLLVLTAFIAAVAVSIPSRQARAYEAEHYTVYCADDRIEISFWDLAQMIVRRGTPVCQFASYTSYSDAISFTKKNFDGEGSPCSC